MRCQVQVIICAMIRTMFFYFQGNRQQHLFGCLLSEFNPGEMGPLSYPSCSLDCYMNACSIYILYSVKNIYILTFYAP